MTVEEYRVSLGWSAAELARQAKLTPRTIARIENGEPAYAHTVGAIARAFSQALGRTITIHDLEGVNIVG
ncbi:MAG TPA: helix-turn-helix transcriptional regulator [Ktedonobacteraceae bacterium]